jgi:hypothetical protein
MRGARATLIAILLVGVAAAAAASDMTLTRNGDLYRVTQTDDGLVVSHRFADGTLIEHLVPQTQGIEASSVQVGVDALTESIFVVWTDGEDLDARIDLAWYAEELWNGPTTIAGGDGTAAKNPQFMLDRFETKIIDDTGEEVDFAATFLHLAWWSIQGADDIGTAYLASVTLDEVGNPNLDEFLPLPLADLLPFGIGCDGIDDADGLAHPMLFDDPQSGSPHIFATDFPNCTFQIVMIDYEVIEEWIGDVKRRRAITVWRNQSMIAINPDMVLASAKVEVGHGLDLVMHWDEPDAVAYVQLTDDGLPPVQYLSVSDDVLSREQAVEMIRALVH